MTSTATAPTAPTAKKPTATRDYIVLRELKDGALVKAGTFNATTADAASGFALDRLDDDAKEATAAFVAVAKSAWNRKAPSVETKTVVKWA